MFDFCCFGNNSSDFNFITIAFFFVTHHRLYYQRPLHLYFLSFNLFIYIYIIILLCKHFIYKFRLPRPPPSRIFDYFIQYLNGFHRIFLPTVDYACCAAVIYIYCAYSLNAYQLGSYGKSLIVDNLLVLYDEIYSLWMIHASSSCDF